MGVVETAMELEPEEGESEKLRALERREEERKGPVAGWSPLPTTIEEAVDELTLLNNPRSPNSGRGRALMRMIAPTLPDLSLELATRTVISVGMQLLDEPKCCLAVADRLLETEAFETKYVRRVMVGLGNLRQKHSGLAEMAIRFAEIGQIPKDIVKLLIHGASLVCQPSQFVRLWSALTPLISGLTSPSAVTVFGDAAAVFGLTLPESLMTVANQLVGPVPKGEPMSRFEVSVGKVLKQLGLKFQSNVLWHGHEVDFHVDHFGKPLALFCDGNRFHRIGGRPNGLLCGFDHLVTLAFQARGINVLRVSNSQFERAKQPTQLLVKSLLALNP